MHFYWELMNGYEEKNRYWKLRTGYGGKKQNWELMDGIMEEKTSIGN